MSTEPKPLLHCIDLSNDSRDTLAALVKLLAPHVPYTIHILGAILNSGPRANTLQDIDPSRVCIWSTIPLHPHAISTTNSELFSIVVFSHLNKQFGVFCSSESSASSDPPTKAERAHIKHIFEYVRDMAREARPLYNAVLTPRESLRRALCIDADTPMIVVGAVHPKWAEVLVPMCACQSSNQRYALPPGTLARDDGYRQTRVLEDEVEVSEIRASDLPFVHAASSIPRSDMYLLSRSPYSVCLRLRADGELGRPVACALMHADGSIGALRVDQRYRRRGLGRLVLCALAEKLDSSQTQGDSGLISDENRDLGGGALGWNWMDTGAQNEAANGFFTTVVGEQRSRSCHWTYIRIDE